MSENNDNILNEHMLDEPMLDEPISDDTLVDIEINDSISSTSSSEQCAICLDSIVKENQCINNCGHKFCKPCLDQYLDSGKTECPLCRQPIQYFEHNSEHFRLILKVSERQSIQPRQQRQQRQIVTNPNHLVVDRKKYMIYKFIFIALFASNIMDMFMHKIYDTQQNLLLEKYQECEKNNTDLQDRIYDLEGVVNGIYPTDDSGYGLYLIIDKLRGSETECYLPTNIISGCFDF